MHLGTDLYRAADAVPISALTGLVAGTTVLTLEGELPVDHLTPGDKVITRDSGVAVLREVRVEEAVLTPIRIKAGSLGHTRPDRDSILAPEAMVLIRDWRAQALFGKAAAVVPARRLVDGEFIAEMQTQTTRVYSLVFDRPHVVYADGLEVQAG